MQDLDPRLEAAMLQLVNLPRRSECLYLGQNLDQRCSRCLFLFVKMGRQTTKRREKGRLIRKISD